MEPKALVPLGIRNPKDIILAGLQKKIDEQGPLRKAFDLSVDFPSRETYAHTPNARDIKRRIVVKVLANEVERYAIGDVVAGWYDENSKEETLGLGWSDTYIIEVSVFTTSSEDADNIAELIKLWMLELTHDLESGDPDMNFPFFFDRKLFNMRFIRGYEGTNMSLRANGPIYVRSLTYHAIMPFFHKSIEQFEQYKINLIQQIVDCIEDVEFEVETSRE